MAELPLLLVLAALLPWIAIRSLRFRRRNTAYRGIRFGFHGRYPEALWVFVLLPVLAVLSAGIAYPYMVYRLKRFLVRHSSYGTAPIRFDARPGPFYLAYLKPVLLVAGVVLVAVVAGSIQGPADLDPQAWSEAPPAGAGVLLLLAVPGYFLVRAYLDATIGNLVFCGIECHGNRLESELRTWPLAWIYASNAAAIALSFGLLYPWAVVRTVRYRVERLRLHASTSLDEFVAGEQQAVGATGEEAGEMLDVEVAI